MKIVLQLILLVAGLYGVLLLFLFLFQSRIIFQPFKMGQETPFAFDAIFEEHYLTTSDGVSINALFFPAPNKSKGVVLYLHGNRGNLNRWGQYHKDFTSLGFDFFIIDYRGFGKSAGHPSEEGIYKDAEAAYQWLLQRYASSKVIIYGRSLGSGPATYLASRHPAKQLILETPYDNIPNVVRAKSKVPIPPGLIRTHFPNDRRLSSVDIPAYIFVGSHDKLIPLRCSARLQPHLSVSDAFFIIEGAGHKNLSDYGEYHHFLAEILLGGLQTANEKQNPKGN